MKFEFNGQTWDGSRDEIVACVSDYMATAGLKLDGAIFHQGVRVAQAIETRGNFVGTAYVGALALEVDEKTPLEVVRQKLKALALDLIPYEVRCDGSYFKGTYEEVFGDVVSRLKQYPISIRNGYATLLNMTIALDTFTLVDYIYVDDQSYLTGEAFVDSLYTEFAEMVI